MVSDKQFIWLPIALAAYVLVKGNFTASSGPQRRNQKISSSVIKNMGMNILDAGITSSLGILPTFSQNELLYCKSFPVKLFHIRSVILQL